MGKAPDLRRTLLSAALLLSCFNAAAQTVPTFSFRAQSNSYTLVGADPSLDQTTHIPTVIVPVELSFAARRERLALSSADIAALQRSPIFASYSFSPNTSGQYADALLRATFAHAENWHTLLDTPQVLKTVHIDVPAADGYLLESHKTGRWLGIADIEYVQREAFKQVPKQSGKFVLLVTRNTAYYTEADSTICCSWGTHGTDQSTGNSFVLASYLSAAPAIVADQDIQPITQQLAEFLYDPLHDPLVRQERRNKPGNTFPRWLRPATMRPGDQGRCGGTGIASAYFLLEPTDTNRKNNFPYSAAFAVENRGKTFHVENVALLPWYLGSSNAFGKIYSFPDARLLSEPAKPCPARTRETAAQKPLTPTVSPIPSTGRSNGHALIGYWTGSGGNGTPFPLREISPQWDIIIVAFAAPVKGAPEGTLRFQPPHGISQKEVKEDIALLKRKGKKVLLSLGGGGEYFTLDHTAKIATFVSDVSAIVSEYGFDGVDIDFETPSLVLAPGDTDFKHPKTPSILNLIAGLRQLPQHFGAGFMISLVPEGPQIPAGHATYGGQFGSYLPLAWELRDILSFMDVQDYNTPPIQGLDGEIYQAGTVDYHAAVAELVLHGFTVGNEARDEFPPLVFDHVAVGFLIGETDPATVRDSMRYLITGSKPVGTTYQLRKPDGYLGMIGAMFWTIDADRLENYPFSNVIGPELHQFPRPK